MIKQIIKNSILYLSFSFFLLILLMLSSSPVVANTSDEFEEKRVLLISSYSPSFPTFYQQIDGIKDTFDGYPIILDVEFMDSKRFYTDENVSNFYESLKYKMNLIEYDLVMVSDDNGLEFIIDNREELFSDMPIVFLGINNEENARLYSQDSLITGVVEEISISDTIELALTLNPKATKVIALVDDTPTGQADLNRFYEESVNFNDIEFLKIDLSEMNFQKFSNEISNVTDDSILLLVSALRDIEGNSYEFQDSVDLILSNTNQPVYHLFEHGIGDGLLGGRIVSHYSQGTVAADIVLSILKGSNISSVPLVDQSPNIYLIDYMKFEEYGLNIKNLPESTLFLNKELTLFEEYREYVITISIALILQTLVIIALIFSVRNRNKARLEAVLSKENLLTAFKQLEEANEKQKESEKNYKLLGDMLPLNMFHYQIIHDENNRINFKILGINKKLEMFLGMKSHELAGKYAWDVFPQTEQYFIEHYENVALSGKTEIFEGYSKSVDMYLKIIAYKIDDDKMAVVMEDISDNRKKQEEILHISYHDSLTGLFNRRYYEDKLEALDNPKNYPLTIVMSDINGLKLINDAFGHTSGDELLKLAANLIKNSTRKSDLIARIGGDEFVIVMPNTSGIQAGKIIDEINKKAENVTVESIQLSISFGFATKTKIKEDIHKVFRSAEDLMYRVKLIEIPSMRSGAIETILNTLYEKDEKSEIHSRVVSIISEKLAIACKMDRQEVNEVKTAGLLHDIGKIIIPTSILIKEGKLTSEEYNLIKGHPEIGFRILNSTHNLRSISNIVLSHHERWDGLGYPRGLKGENISLQSRIISIADAFDAMTSQRTYRETLTKEDALTEIVKNAGTQFDPKLVETFKLYFDVITDITTE